MVESFRGRLRIRLPRQLYSGRRKYLCLSLTDVPDNWKFAEAKAKQIENDILYERFDPSLKRYRPPVHEPPPSEKPITLLALWEQYAKVRAPLLQPSSRKIFPAIANKLKLCPHKSLDRAAQIKGWLLENGSQDAARRTVQQLNAASEWALEQGLIEVNPFAKLKPIQNKSKSPPDPFSPSERDLIIETFSSSAKWSRYAPFVAFRFLTGCRPSEAIALRWSDLDPARENLTFATAIVEGIRKPTKTNRLRTFPINARLKEFIDALPPGTGDAPVLAEPSGEIIDLEDFAEAWRETVGALSIRYRRAYNCRHTFITECLRAGVSIKQVAAWCGVSPKVILENYAGLVGESVPDF